MSIRHVCDVGGEGPETFFRQVMPKFNLENTPYYILTRSFETSSFAKPEGVRAVQSKSVWLPATTASSRLWSTKSSTPQIKNARQGKKQTLLFVFSTV